MAVLRDFVCDKLHVRVFDARQEMGTCAGMEVAACIKELLSKKDSINVMFAAAPSQNETLAALLESDGVDWSRINAFHMDEYVGLDPEHPAGFRNFLKRAILDLRDFKSVNLCETANCQRSKLHDIIGVIHSLTALSVWERHFLGRGTARSRSFIPGKPTALLK